jgi:hypothetical protein
VTGETVLVPGGRDVRATLDSRGGDRVVVACPPHPQFGGDRSDRRLRAVSDALGQRGVDCLRFDYGAWDRGRGERTDARNAVGWANERYDRAGLFGYSFGAAVALTAAAEEESEGRADGKGGVAAASALAPPAGLSSHLDAVAALDAISVPLQVIYGVRDDTVDWRPVVERARELDREVVELGADHHFVGQGEKVGEAAAGFLAANLG